MNQLKSDIETGIDGDKIKYMSAMYTWLWKA